MAEKYPLGAQIEFIVRIAKREPFWFRTEPFKHPALGLIPGVGVSEHSYLHLGKGKTPPLEIGDKVRIIYTRTETRKTGPRRNRFFGRKGAKVDPSASLDTPLKSRVLWLFKWEYIGQEHEDLYGSGYEGYEENL